ncbi:MAG: fibronectin type III domain-containing protein, partial [Coriobacteriales bacterium]|nr:fibronectin type III domain-containing protein [Coriobacteriales bacterium]
MSSIRRIGVHDIRIRSLAALMCALWLVALLPAVPPAASAASGDTAPPVAHVAVPYYSSSASVSSRFPVSWSAADTSGIASYTLDYKDGYRGAWRRWKTATRSTRAVFAGAAGHTYWFRVFALDGAGNQSAWSRPDVITVPYDDRSARVRYRGAWTRYSSGAAFGRATRRSSARGSTASLSFVGQKVAVICGKSPKSGRFAVYLDGSPRPARIVDTRSPTSRARQVVYNGTFKRYGNHRITVKVLATPGRPRVDVDAIAVVRPDRISPPAPVVTLAGGASHTRARAAGLAVNASDNIAVAAYQTSHSASFSDSRWRSYVPESSITLRPGEGTRRVYVRVRDEAGNVSAASSDSLVVDTTRPSVIERSLPETVPAGESRPAVVEIRDRAPVSARLAWTEPGEPSESSTPMTPRGGGVFSADLPPHDAGVRISYRVVASDAAGNTGVLDRPAEEPDTAWTHPSELPTAPAGLVATAADRRVELSWDGELAVDESFEVWRASSSRESWEHLGGTQMREFVDTTPHNSHTYRYTVSVRRGATHGPRSAAASATLEAFSGRCAIPLDTSARGWGITDDIDGAVLPVRVPQEALSGCQKPNLSDLAFYDSSGKRLDCSARLVTRNAGTRAVAYQMSNKLLTHRDGEGEWTYLTYSKVRQLEGIAQPSGAAAIVRYNRLTGEHEERVFDQATTDNHGGYTIWFDSEGRLNAVGGAHHQPTEHYRARTPYGIDLRLVDAHISDAGGGVGFPRTHGVSTYPVFVPGSSGSAYGVLRMTGTLTRPAYSLAWHYFDGERWARPVTIAEMISPTGRIHAPTYDNFVISASDGTAYAFAHRFEVTPAYRGINGFVMCTSNPETATPSFTTADAARTPVGLPANQNTMTKLGSYSLSDNTRLLRIGRDDQGAVYAGVLSVAGSRAGRVDIYRVKAGEAPRRTGTLNTRFAGAPTNGGPLSVTFTVVGGRMVALYDGTSFGANASGGVWMATSQDWGASWSPFVRAIPAEARPSWLPALPAQDMGGEQLSWPLPIAYQNGGASSDGDVTARLAELTQEGSTHVVLSPGLEVWVLLRGVDVSGDAENQYITVEYGDRYADPPEHPED